jgi:hypothetical protein
MSNVAISQDNDGERDETERKDARPYNRRENERREFFRRTDDSVHKVLP